MIEISIDDTMVIRDEEDENEFFHCTMGADLTSSVHDNLDKSVPVWLPVDLLHLQTWLTSSPIHFTSLVHHVILSNLSLPSSTTALCDLLYAWPCMNPSSYCALKRTIHVALPVSRADDARHLAFTFATIQNTLHLKALMHRCHHMRRHTMTSPFRAALIFL